MIARPMCPSACTVNGSLRYSTYACATWKNCVGPRKTVPLTRITIPRRRRPEPSRVELWSVRANVSPPFEFGQNGIFVPSGTRTPPAPALRKPAHPVTWNWSAVG